MKNALATKPRPLAKLAPMIRKELKAGFQAGERHWKIVGRLLNEAREHFPKSGPNKNGMTFHQWVADNFQHPWTNEPLAKKTVTDWMRAVRNGSGAAAPELSLTAARGDKGSPHHEDYNPQLDWKSNVRKVQQKINPEQLKKQWEDEDRQNRERAALARKIVDAGYRALAPMVHPDRKGGSREAMAKLTDARKWLEEQIRRYS